VNKQISFSINELVVQKEERVIIDRFGKTRKAGSNGSQEIERFFGSARRVGTSSSMP